MIRSSYAFINLVKAMCGVGVFALPVAFQQAGLWTGTVLAFALGIVNAQSMTKLVKCSQYLGSRKETERNIDKSDEAAIPMMSLSEKDTSRTNPEDSTTHSRPHSEESGEEEKRVALNYGNMAYEAFASQESDSMKKLAEPAKILVNICIIGLQIGFCSSYYIFVVDHAKEAIDYLLSTEISRDTLFFSILPFFILIASVRSLAVLSWIGLLGNILVISAIIIIIKQMLFMDHIPLSQLPAFASIEGTTLAAGSIIYAYSAQGVVLPLENKMKKPQDMLGLFGVISTSVAFISVVYTITGFLGYITYGDKLKGSITLNLTNSPVDFSVKVMLLLTNYCGYLIQHYPVYEMLWPSVQNRMLEAANDSATLFMDFALRYAIVVLSFGLAYVIPNFKDIVPFVGVTTGMMLALFFPPLLETVAFYESWRKGSSAKFIFSVALNVFYVLLGILFMIVGIYSNYQVLSKQDNP